LKTTGLPGSFPASSKDKNRSRATGWLLFLFSSLYLYPFVRVLWRVGDEGTLVYGAQRVVEGALPYRDFFEVMGPGSFYWLGLFFKLFGTRWLVARGLLLLTGVATVMLMYWLTRRLDHSRSAILPAAFFLVISIPIWPAANHHWDSNLFALLAVGAFCLWQDKGRKAYLPIAGVVAGITSCFMQQKGLLLLLAFLVVAFISGYQAKERRSKILSNLGLLTAGYAGVGSFVLIFFYLAGGLSDLLYANLLWPLSNYHKVNVMPYGFYLFELIKPSWESIYSRLFSLPWAKALSAITLIPFYLIFALPAVLVSMIVGCSFNQTNRAKIFNPATLSYLILGLALWVSELHRKDIIHLIYGSPLFLIISFVLFKQCLGKKRVLYGLIIGILCLGFFSLATINAVIATTANHQMSTRRGNIYCFEEDGALDFLLEKTKPGEPVFIYPYYPMYYFLAAVKNPTRYSILIYQINTEAQFNEVINDLEKKRVKYVLWDTCVSGSNLSTWFPQYCQPSDERLILEKYLVEHYDVMGEKNKFKILRRREN
jgi:4-amino-4-deoxy-L-arabinose transferase-like glycosyltransferase